MKFVISLILMMTTSAHANPIQIFYEEDSEAAIAVKGVLTQTYQIPEELISLMPVSKCEGVQRKGKLDLCLKNNGELLIVSVDRGFISESLKIFNAP